MPAIARGAIAMAASRRQVPPPRRADAANIPLEMIRTQLAGQGNVCSARGHQSLTGSAGPT